MGVMLGTLLLCVPLIRSPPFPKFQTTWESDSEELRECN